MLSLINTCKVPFNKRHDTAQTTAAGEDVQLEDRHAARLLGL